MNLSPVDRSELRQALIGLFEQEIEGFTAAGLESSFDDLEIDSFALLTLRAAVETALSRPFTDSEWTTIHTPAQLLSLALKRGKAVEGGGDAVPPFVAARSYVLGMPHLSLRGLSESWLFKELGDFHWSLIAEGLGLPIVRIEDADGYRLYGTFSRLRITCTNSLADFREGDVVGIRGAIRRFGAGIFLGDYTVASSNGYIVAQLMSTFARRMMENNKLERAQPIIPSTCRIPPLSAIPEFGAQYLSLRANPPPAGGIAGATYQIEPFRDINNVGLVYFASHPTIVDICESRRHENPVAYAKQSATVSRDVFYFANSNIDECLKYDVATSDRQGDLLSTRSILTRASDGVVMAVVDTIKVFDNV